MINEPLDLYPITFEPIEDHDMAQWEEAYKTFNLFWV